MSGGSLGSGGTRTGGEIVIGGGRHPGQGGMMGSGTRSGVFTGGGGRGRGETIGGPRVAGLASGGGVRTQRVRGA